MMKKMYSLGTAALLVVSACEQSPIDPTGADGAQMALNSTSTSATATAEEINVCKVGPAGTYNFDVTGPAPKVSAGNLNLDAGLCTRIAFGGGATYFATVVENVPAGFVLDSIVVDQMISGVTTSTKYTGTNQATAQAGGFTPAGAVISFYNSLILSPQGSEGCTPGYWRQPQHFHNYTAPYTPTTQFNSVFAGGFPGMTLSQVAARGGGGLNALARHAVAALLNAASPNVDYDMTVAEVIAAYDAVWNGSANAIEAQKDAFEGFNEQGCPL